MNIGHEHGTTGRRANLVALGIGVLLWGLSGAAMAQDEVPEGFKAQGLPRRNIRPSKSKRANASTLPNVCGAMALMARVTALGPIDCGRVLETLMPGPLKFGTRLVASYP